ncbi:hypothetical protein GCM10014715_39760 [Streptomyces spiralis]|uniref:Uncharacterized protein n=1 Tax=Streptomyces spiralis TaxID=66376 RepID=A0A919A1S2_9ACTN|nr:hypothetical protein GCM10014715_39760 [Streptomyces spiralis]
MTGTRTLESETYWRSPSGATGDRNYKDISHVGLYAGAGGRRPGRPRIATSSGST